MKFFMPTVGTQLKLTEDFYFNIMNEYRNRGFLEAMGLKDSLSNQKYVQVMLPKSVILKIDRIYIRKGMPQFDSLTFYVDKKSLPFTPQKGKLRFWINLDDINDNMEVEVLNQKDSK